MADSGNARLQFLFTVIAVTVSDISIPITGLKPDELAFVFVIASAFLTLVGWHAYDYMNNRMLATDVNTRAIARIRGFFIDNDPDILPYLTWQTDDKPIRFTIDKKKGMMWVTQITFCILISCLASSFIIFIPQSS